MTTSGYIRLHRKLIENPLWHQMPEAWLKIWIGILLRANFRPSQIWDRKTGKQVEIPAGAFVISISTLAEFTKCTPKQIRGTLAYLERAQMVARLRAGSLTVLVVENWDSYQLSGQDEGKVEGKVEGKDGAYTRAQRGQGEGKDGATEEEVKNIRREEIKENTTPPAPPQAGDCLLFPDAKTSTPTPSMVRPPVRTKRKKQTPPAMSAEQQAWFAEFLSVHPRNTEQPARAFKLWAEKVTSEEVFQWLMETLRRECAGDTTYMRGAGNWLEDHLTLWANGAQANIKQPQPHAPDRTLTKGQKAVRELWAEQQEGIQ